MMLIRPFLWAALLWAVLLIPAEAHQGQVHQQPIPAATARSQPTASTAVQADPSPADALDMTEVSPEVIASKVPQPVHLLELDWADSMMGHVHNKLVHFPLALGLAASLLWVLALRRPGHVPAARLLLVGAALLGIASVLTGENQKGVYADSPFVEILGWHEKMGFISLAVLILGAGWQWHKSWARVVWIYGLVLMVLVLFTGFLGGVVSHGHVATADADPSMPAADAHGGH